MLKDHPAHATLPTADVDALRRFYEDVLGFEPSDVTPGGVFYEAAGGTRFAVTRSGGKPSGTHTQLGFQDSDLPRVVRELKGRGVVFEEYETPKTTDGIADVPAGRAAWFRDPDGNLIGLVELRTAT